GGNPANIALYGQDENDSAWAICKINMILHGINDDEQIKIGDVIHEPQHKESGALMRFDRVLSNPPFSMRYTKAGLEKDRRFKYGFPSESGKKADFMFVQHMLGVLKPDGLMATVMPHGVLFRKQTEGEIREGMIEDDVIEAVIGIAPN